MREKHWGDEARVQAELLGVDASDGAKLLTVALLAFRNAKTKRCDPSEQRLAEVLGRSERTVQRNVRLAEQAGLITVISGGRGCRNSYVIHDSPEELAALREHPKSPRRRHQRCTTDKVDGRQVCPPSTDGSDGGPDVSYGTDTSQSRRPSTDTPGQNQRQGCRANSTEHPLNSLKHVNESDIESETEGKPSKNHDHTTNSVEVAEEVSDFWKRMREKYPSGMMAVEASNRDFRDEYVGRPAKWAEHYQAQGVPFEDLVAAIDRWVYPDLAKGLTAQESLDLALSQVQGQSKTAEKSSSTRLSLASESTGAPVSSVSQTDPEFVSEQRYLLSVMDLDRDARNLARERIIHHGETAEKAVAFALAELGASPSTPNIDPGRYASPAQRLWYETVVRERKGSGEEPLVAGDHTAGEPHEDPF